MLPLRDSLPTRSFPFVNYALIAANVAAFVLELTNGDPNGGGLGEQQWALVPSHLIHNPAAALPTLFTHMFLHGSFSHIGGNMLYLWIFGDNVEDALGHLRYLLFYLACGVAAACAQVLAGPNSHVPMIGASGAIAGVLAAYMLLYPRSPITVLNPIPLLWIFWGLFFYLPAWFIIVEFFVVNLWSALQPSNAAGGVAFMAHVGGFIAGLVLLPILRAYAPHDHDRWDRYVTPRAGRLSR